jgi:hypothetical protein
LQDFESRFCKILNHDFARFSIVILQRIRWDAARILEKRAVSSDAPRYCANGFNPPQFTAIPFFRDG